MAFLTVFKRESPTSYFCEKARKKVKNYTEAAFNLQIETCFNVELSDEEIEVEDEEKLKWILSTPFQESFSSKKSFLDETDNDTLIEIGPRLNFSTPFSTNAVSICKSAGLQNVKRIEKSTRYLLQWKNKENVSDEIINKIVDSLHDRMTECRYLEPIKSFTLDVKKEEVFEIDVLNGGKEALEKANRELGLAFDDWDLDYYTKMFQTSIRRNPTNVECFDLAQSNSEHSRHWFFKGKLKVDGTEHPETLFAMIMKTQENSNENNVIKFSDNSSGIKGFEIPVLQPADSTCPSAMKVRDIKRHIIFTAETHNFPTGVAPFPGATTGTGGRIRDVQAAGRGAHVVAGTAGYCFGNLLIPGYELPWEDHSAAYPPNFAHPVEIAVEASNGASDYGNKFGEPVLAGFARAFGLKLPSGERREYIKPIMFSGGLGQLDEEFIKKEQPQPGMVIAKIGGPVYRIGVGGGAASSVQVQGDNKADLDFGAVQRGDPEMEQKLNRLVRSCLEMGTNNIIKSIHDQGAGGNGNVLKEIAEPEGAVIMAKNFSLGDPTLNDLEIWGAEYQESNAILLDEVDVDTLKTISKRERCPVDIVGKITGDGKIRFMGLHAEDEIDGSPAKKKQRRLACCPVDLQLKHVLGSMPQKEFCLDHAQPVLSPLSLPEGLSVKEALERVLRLPSVASKRYLTNKVDRCVTGLVAQQQCVGPLHTPLADVAVTALSYYENVGSATSIGEQPIKGLVDPCCGARMSVGEALTNIVFALITDIKDIKCSGNWMWAAKLPGEGALLFDACQAMCNVMSKLGIAIDGGKDSLSMAARVGDNTVKAPGTLVISAYCGCPDITATVTPDLKCSDKEGTLLFIDLGGGKKRLGGSSLAQCYQQIGNESPDLENTNVFVKAFNVTQTLLKERKILSGHDVSDGGLVTCLLEMAFAGNCGLDIQLPSGTHGILETLFAEELGLVLEVTESNKEYVCTAYARANVPCEYIGKSTKDVKKVKISAGNSYVLDDDMIVLRDIWEETSFQLENYQTNPKCVAQEQAGLKARTEPAYNVPFESDIIMLGARGSLTSRPVVKVAVLREEGSNSDREMAAVLEMAGFQVWDICMQDLCSGGVTLDQFRGLVFVGGFSYADVCGSAKGWAATALFNQEVQTQFMKFKENPNTFSLGVCNGCQLMALLGWVAPDEEQKENINSGVGQGVLFDHNQSSRFECRFSTVRVYNSPSIMMKGMEDLVFGIWSAHGEGQVVFKDQMILNDLNSKKLIPVRYCDDQGQPTTEYPLNPNGSPEGIAALCSEDGRHLAIMPHPERCFLPWQCPWMPLGMRETLDASPWMKMFQNAYTWCCENSS